MYVLVHGAGMGASCWEPLLKHLDGPAITVDLPGRGSRADTPVAGVTLDDCAAAILEDVGDAEDLVLVAHSFAGVSVPRVMAELTPRIRHVAFLSAVVPPDGTRVIDQIDPAVRSAVEASIVDGVYHQTPEGAEMMLCNDMDAAQTEWTLAQVVDDSAALLIETVDLSGLEADVPRTYIRLTNDTCYPPELQGPSAEVVGGSTVYLDSGHMAMVSIPEQLAAALADLGSD